MNKFMLCAGVACAGLFFAGCNDPGSALKNYAEAVYEKDYEAMNKYSPSEAHLGNAMLCIGAEAYDTIEIVGKPEIKDDVATVTYTVEKAVCFEVKEVNGEWKVVDINL